MHAHMYKHAFQYFMSQGTNLSSVDRGEINVRVGGVLCEDRGSNSDGVNFVSVSYFV